MASSVVTSLYASKFWMAPWLTKNTANTSDSGTSSQVVMRVTSTQKLPITPVDRAAKPRIRANTTAMPVAADRKFCTARPSICVR